jgi:hypothetical protein
MVRRSGRSLEPASAQSKVDKEHTMTAFSNPAGTWNQHYSTVEGDLFGTAPSAWLVRHAQAWQSGQRVLCLADGEGRNSV